MDILLSRQWCPIPIPCFGACTLWLQFLTCIACECWTRRTQPQHSVSGWLALPRLPRTSTAAAASHLGSAPRRISDAWEQGQGEVTVLARPSEAEQLEDSLDVNELQLSILIVLKLLSPNLFLQGFSRPFGFLGFLPTFLTKQLRASGGAASLSKAGRGRRGNTKICSCFCLAAHFACISPGQDQFPPSSAVHRAPCSVSCSAVSASKFLIFVKRSCIFILQWGLANHSSI